MGAGRTATFLRTQPETQNKTRKGPERASFWIFCLIREGGVPLFPRTALTSSNHSLPSDGEARQETGHVTRKKVPSPGGQNPGRRSLGRAVHALCPQCTSVRFRRSVVSDSLRPHGPQHARPPCPSPSPGVCSNSCPSRR